MINKFDEKILVNVNREDDDLVSKVQTLNYTTGWTPPQGSDNSILYTTEYVKNNLAAVAHFSIEDPINPDTDPISTVWVKVTDTYPREVVDIFFWSKFTSRRDIKMVSSFADGGNLLVIIKKSDSTLYASGANNYGNLGLGDTVNRKVFTSLNIINPRKFSISASNFIEKSDGTVWRCGWNHVGQLGLGDTTNRSSLVQLTGFENPIKIISVSYSTIIEKSDGTLWVTGNYHYGSFGLGDTAQRTSFTQVPGISYTTKLLHTYNCTYLEKLDGTIWSCGKGGIIGTEYNFKCFDIYSSD